MDRKLVKEIITTETEKFTEDGNIKERVKEIKEKIYSTEAINADEVEVVEATPQPQTEPPKEEKKEDNQDLIKEAAKAIESHNTQTPTQPQQPPQQPPYMPPNNYNVLNRTTPMPMGQPTMPQPVKFP
ncbi:MAG: hypothetical protein MSA56_06975 [Clostridium sp.]|nr:hypothetical protein [Clostridium sp.]